MRPRRAAVAATIALTALAAPAAGCGAVARRARRHPVTAPPRPALTQPPPLQPTPAGSPPAPAPTAPTPPASALPAPAQPAPAGEEFGVNVNRLFNDLTFTPAQIDAQLTALRATGATVARSDALWEFSEPAPPVDGVHHYDWAFDDAIAVALTGHGLAWLPILDYTAVWDESVAGQDHSPPASVGDYAAYAGAFAARYGPGGVFWRQHPALTADPVTTFEIWNEPDNGEFWTPAPDAAAYADLYLAARSAIDAVDPTARVIVGGLTAPATFLPAMLAARPVLAGHIDGVAIHPYGAPLVVLSKIRAARATLVLLGLGAVPLYVTEFGWTTAPPGTLDYVPAGRRDTDIASTLTALGHLDCGVAAAILYTWVTPERDPANGGDWFGINPPGGGASAATAAFTAGLRGAAAAGPADDLCATG